jgi:hypothetical protein
MPLWRSQTWSRIALASGVSERYASDLSMKNCSRMNRSPRDWPNALSLCFATILPGDGLMRPNRPALARARRRLRRQKDPARRLRLMVRWSSLLRWFAVFSPRSEIDDRRRRAVASRGGALSPGSLVTRRAAKPFPGTALAKYLAADRAGDRRVVGQLARSRHRSACRAFRDTGTARGDLPIRRQRPRHRDGGSVPWQHWRYEPPLLRGAGSPHVSFRALHCAAGAIFSAVFTIVCARLVGVTCNPAVGSTAVKSASRRQSQPAQPSTGVL